MNKEIKYSTGKEVRKKLKISSCELMHLREEGKLDFFKKGNAYYYGLNSENKI